MKDVSIVIVSWNVRDRLRACLGSIYRFTSGIEFEVFVVDNNSADGSADMVSAEFPDVRLIRNKDNRGFAKANNQALRDCAGRYALLLNPDTELVDNACKAMVDFMEANPDAEALGCRLLHGDGSLQPSCRRFPSLFIDLMETFYLDSLFPKSGIFNRYRMGGWDHSHTREVDQPYGACLLVRRNALDRVGLMDERFFMYYDEIDLCYRIKRSGGRVYFSNVATVIHHANESSKQASVQCERYKDRSRLLFFAKRYGRPVVFLLAFNLAIKTALVWMVFGLSHRLFGRPRDLGHFKAPILIMWGEIAAFFKRPVT